jgi:hypothetical protein
VNTHEARPTKLPNGEWGARIVGAIVEVGDELSIKAASGKSWKTNVAQVISVVAGTGVTLVATTNNQGQGVKMGGQLWEECPRCGFEPVYLPLCLCERCWPK